MSPTPQVSAAAANDAYLDRPLSDVDSKSKSVFLHGKEYRIFGYKNEPLTGFHATAYQDKATGEIIIAYRGTDPEYKTHTRTTLQDAAVDYTMVKSQVNTQKADADAFTQEMLNKAQQNGISKDHVFVAGHSLGGTLAEIEAWEHGLRGTTLNAYGAVDLIYGVPQGGQQVTNYVMAGDVVSAGGHHFGEVKVLASVEDIAALRTGRYLDAAAGEPPPNPLLAMKLSDHSGTHFTGEGGVENLLAPGNIAANEARYMQNRVAIDHFRNDVYQARAELGEVLRRADSRSIAATLGNMSPHLQRQLAELHATWVDVPIQQAVEHNGVVQGAGQALDYTAAGLRTSSEHVQQDAEQLSRALRAAGQSVQHTADDVAQTSLRYSAINPLAAAGVALGATVFGYTARADAEGLAQAADFGGKATRVMGQLAAEQLQGAKKAMEAGAHVAAQRVTGAVHVNEVSVVAAIDGTLLAYQAANVAKQALGHGATQAYDATRDAVAQGTLATRHAADLAYSALTHPEQWFGNSSTPLQTVPAPMAVVAVPLAAIHAVTIAANTVHAPTPVVAAPKPGHRPTTTGSPTPIAENLRDFRHAEHPLHTKYRNTLEQVHAMEDKGRMAHGAHSEQLASALTSAMHKDGFGGLARIEMRGPNHALQAVAHQNQPNAAGRELSVDVNTAMSRSVEQHSQDWSMRALPHVHQQVPAWERDGDPRHRDNPDHGLFNQLRTRIPEASENRLLQCTAACHSNGITGGNLIHSHLDEANMKLIFVGSSALATLATVDLNTSSPQPQQSNQHIQQLDQQQAQMRSQNQAQSAQVNQQGPMR